MYAGLVLLAVVGAAAMAPAAAGPPTALVESAPRDGEVIAAPTRLVLRFSTPVDAKEFSMFLVTPAGTTILLLKVQPRTAADTVAWDLPPLGAGAHQARWRLVVAGQAVEGVLRFTVKGR